MFVLTRFRDLLQVEGDEVFLTLINNYPVNVTLSLQVSFLLLFPSCLSVQSSLTIHN